MNNIFKKIIIIFFFLNLPISAYSNELIAYLDIDYIFKNSNLGKQIVLNLNEENKKNLLQLKKKENELKKIEKDLTNKKKFLTDEEFNKIELDWRGQIKYTTMIKKICEFNRRSEFILKVLKDTLKENPDQQIMILGHQIILLIIHTEKTIYSIPQ